jgi:uncharacterized protein
MRGPSEPDSSYTTRWDLTVVDEEGNTRISYEDYAMVMVDELESPRPT